MQSYVSLLSSGIPYLSVLTAFQGHLVPRSYEPERDIATPLVHPREHPADFDLGQPNAFSVLTLDLSPSLHPLMISQRAFARSYAIEPREVRVGHL